MTCLRQWIIGKDPAAEHPRGEIIRGKTKEMVAHRRGLPEPAFFLWSAKIPRPGKAVTGRARKGDSRKPEKNFRRDPSMAKAAKNVKGKKGVLCRLFSGASGTGGAEILSFENMDGKVFFLYCCVDPLLLACATGAPAPCGAGFFSGALMDRVISFIDGFNCYHALLESCHHAA